MYLMEGTELLDAHVFNRRLETIVTYLKLKSIYYSTSFCRKIDNEFDRKKEMEVMREERE